MKKKLIPLKGTSLHLLPRLLKLHYLSVHTSAILFYDTIHFSNNFIVKSIKLSKREVEILGNRKLKYLDWPD